MEQTLTRTPVRYRFTATEYVAMGEKGIIAPDIRTELLDGEVIEMSPIGWPHASLVTRLSSALMRICGDHALVWTQNPVQLDEWSIPLPDVALLRPRADFYADGGPRPEDVTLLVEVSDSSLSFDRTRKLRLYAAASIPKVWIVDVAKRRIHMFAEPGGDSYASQRTAERPEFVVVPCGSTEVSVGSLIG